ncbi:hypothetical protein TWF281_008411 [Arthrobotrys megalospora]
MKSFVAPVVLSMMAVGASAYTSEPPTSTTPTPKPTGCPATYDPACHFFCGSRGSGSYCTSSNFLTGPGTPGCNVCPGIPGECPAVPEKSCAYLCTKTGEIVLGPGSPDVFCSPNNATLGPLNVDLTGPNAITCVPCESDDGEPEPTTTTATPVPTSRPTGCPATFDPECPYYCSSVRAPGPFCSTSFSIGIGGTQCTVCPGHPSSCPAVPDESCAFLCEGAPSTGINQFCYPNNITMFPTSEGLPNLINCVACGGGGNPTYPPPTNTTSVPPPPEYTGAASRFSISGAAVFGLAAMAIFIL